MTRKLYDGPESHTEEPHRRATQKSHTGEPVQKSHTTEPPEENLTRESSTSELVSDTRWPVGG